MVAARESDFLCVCDMNCVKKFIRWRIAQFRIMLEHDQFPNCHFAAGCTVVIFKHIQDCLPQQLQVIL